MGLISGQEIEPSVSLSINDPTPLWINSGVATWKILMEPLSNLKIHDYKCPKAIRTNDIENEDCRHHTMLEMLNSQSEIISVMKPLRGLMNFWQASWMVWFPKDKSIYDSCNPSWDRWCRSVTWSQSKTTSGNRRPSDQIFDRGEALTPSGSSAPFAEDIENDRYIEIWNIVRHT